MAPILGRAWVAYVPDGRVVGISKLARVVEAYAKRLQIQEKLTAQIANTINDVLKPRGVGVIIRATHHCMTARGVHKHDTDLVTSRMLGCFRDNPQLPTVTAINGSRATLKGGGTLEADLVVIGVGVRPRLALAEQRSRHRSRRNRECLPGDKRPRRLCRR